ncbi:MAG: metalloregulator ArsR/SmtB family transcription factor [Desulfobacteraceae bacterium]
MPQSIQKCCPSPSLEKIPLNTDRLAEICKALAHPARIQILSHLKAIDQCICGQLVEVLPLAQSTVSQHLKILKIAGLIKGEVEGPRTCYCINHDALEELNTMLAAI